jgi:hypothetical protein
MTFMKKDLETEKEYRKDSEDRLESMEKDLEK